MRLNIPQLTLGELAQWDRHGTINTKVLAGSIPTRGKLFAEIIYPSLPVQSNTKMTTLPTFMSLWENSNAKVTENGD